MNFNTLLRLLGLLVGGVAGWDLSQELQRIGAQPGLVPAFALDVVIVRRLIENLDRDVFETADSAQESSSLARAFASLSESDRELLSLVAWEGLTREELAVAFGTSRAVVRLRLHRASKRLHAALPPTQVRFTGGQEHEWT